MDQLGDMIRSERTVAGALLDFRRASCSEPSFITRPGVLDLLIRCERER